MVVGGAHVSHEAGPKVVAAVAVLLTSRQRLEIVRSINSASEAEIGLE